MTELKFPNKVFTGNVIWHHPCYRIVSLVGVVCCCNSLLMLYKNDEVPKGIGSSEHGRP